MLFSALLLSPALAADGPFGAITSSDAELPSAAIATDATDPLSADAAAKKKDKDRNKDGKKDKDKGKDDEKKKGDTFWGFEIEPYVAPGGGVQIDSSGDLGITAGADVGVLYTKKKFTGNLYLGGSFITGDNVSGYDVHLGNTANYRVKYWGAGGGLAVTYNGQQDADGDATLAPSLGVQVPVEIVVGPKKYYGLAGITPAWYFDEKRKPEAGEVPFGDEFEWHVGAGFKYEDFKVQAAYSMVFTDAGQYGVPTVSVGYGG